MTQKEAKELFQKVAVNGLGRIAADLHTNTSFEMTNGLIIDEHAAKAGNDALLIRDKVLKGMDND